MPVSVINTIASKTVPNEHDRILLDVNVVRSFALKMLHYFEVEDMQRFVVAPNTRGMVESLITAQNK